MGRRKIEIKAIKDDRNRSVTFLKRKGGLFKKAHELSVLCSVDVAVFIFGSNKKLYEYSSSDMRELIHRYTYHGGPTEHKGPSDFNGGVDDDDDDDENGTPPQADALDAPPMLPPQFPGQPQFPQIRHHTPSASPPIPNAMFGPHAAHAMARARSPQPPMGSRPSSRTDMRRMGPNMVPQPVGPPGPPQGQPVNGYAYMPQPAMYNPQHGMAPVHPPYGQSGPYHAPQPHPQMQQYMEEQRRSSVPPNFPPQGPSAPHPPPRHSTSPPQPHRHQLPQQSLPHMSPPPPQTHLHPMQSPPPPQPQHQPSSSPRPPVHELPRVQVHPEYQLPAPVEPRHNVSVKQDTAIERVRPPLLDTGVKKHKGSIFTPIDENRSILSQHLAAFHPPTKQEASTSRSHATDAGEAVKQNTSSPPSLPPVSASQRSASVSSMSEAAFVPPSRSNSIQTPLTARPRLKVQIPDEPSEAGSATAESSSPRGTATDTASQPSRRATETYPSGVVLPPPSPSASALLSAGASGPPNPFARPVPSQSSSMNMDTPVSALPSRFLQGEFLPSPSSFYPDWNFRGAEHNTLPSPLNFATPVAGNGPSFLRDDPPSTKRKSADMTGNGPVHEGMDMGNEPKRVKVDT